MKDTRIKLSDGRVLVITNGQMWSIALSVAWGISWPIIGAVLVISFLGWLLVRLLFWFAGL